MTNRSEWEGRTGNKWASEWRRTDRAFTGLTDRLLGRASERPFSRALDIGCGAGELTLALARGHPRARVTGIDISGELISVARERGAHLDNARFEVADAAHWFNSDFAPDLVVSRHGVMFFDEPIPAFANLAAGAGPDARLVFSCFRDRAHNPWATSIVALLPKGTVPPAAPDAPGPFAFADRSRVEHLLRSAGWGDSAFEKVDFAYVVGAGQDPVGDARSFFLSIGPAAAAAAELPGAERAEFIKRLEIFLEDQRDRDLIAFPAAAWIVSAQRA